MEILKIFVREGEEDEQSPHFPHSWMKGRVNGETDTLIFPLS